MPQSYTFEFKDVMAPVAVEGVLPQDFNDSFINTVKFMVASSEAMEESFEVS